MNTRGPGFGVQLAGLSGVALILIMFIFAWFGVPGTGLDAFDAFDDWVGLILVFTAFAGMELWLVGGDQLRVGMPVALSAIATGLGILSVVVLFIYLVSPPSFGGQDLDRKIGIWFGLLAAIGVAAGGWMAMQEEGARFGEGERYRRPPRERPDAGPPPPSEGPYE